MKHAMLLIIVSCVLAVSGCESASTSTAPSKPAATPGPVGPPQGAEVGKAGDPGTAMPAMTGGATAEQQEMAKKYGAGGVGAAGPQPPATK